MHPLLRNLAVCAAFALAGVYCLVALRGPQGVQALLDKYDRIRTMQEENASLARENEKLRQRNKSLRDSQAAQEQEIREKLGRMRKGERSFVIPDAKKTEDNKNEDEDEAESGSETPDAP
jgi:cell division protein FtsB